MYNKNIFILILETPNEVRERHPIRPLNGEPELASIAQDQEMEEGLFS